VIQEGIKMNKQLAELISEHRTLDWEIKKLELLSPFKEDEIKILKKKKLNLKDRIEALKINDNRETIQG
tara:strand:- start:467 stop:673 length:207 start_codon:yes stop_codon:yes gene_type:complete